MSWAFITPLHVDPQRCLSVGQAPSQGLAYELSEDVVIKMPFQYLFPDDLDEKAEEYRDRGLRSFASMEKEVAVYNAIAEYLQSHFARRLSRPSSTFLALERLTPLEQACAQATQRTRYAWVNQLVSAVADLEDIGFTHGDLAVRNIGVDSMNRLKFFDFGSATPKEHPGYDSDIKGDHSGLATCLHFVLTGVDPLSAATTVEARQIRKMMSSGQLRVDHKALPLQEIIQAGWTGTTGSSPFSLVRDRVQRLTAGKCDPPSSSRAPDYSDLENRCDDLVHELRRDERWLDAECYCKAWQDKGYEADLDLWR